MHGIVILGTGLAGYTLAREIRKRSSEVRLTLVSADAGGFYSKPMLSNALAAGKRPEQLVSQSAEQMAGQLDARVLPGTHVRALDRAARRLDTECGELRYDQLVLALGASPIRLPLAGSGAADVLSVNDIADYALFRVRLEGARRVALLGAGLIGCEFANDLALAGYAVTVFDIAAQPLGRLLPAAAGAHLRGRLGEAGVAWQLSTAITRVDRVPGGYRLADAEGRDWQADIVLSAVGLQARRELASAAGLACGRGIRADPWLRTSDPDIHALGDCAEVGGTVLPFVMPIMHGARALAATLTGAPQPVVYPAMPVVVKTPACPTVVCPPPPGVEGAWQEHCGARGVRALYVDPLGALRGFALLGEACAEKQALGARLPPRVLQEASTAIA